jgi:hypothetical protein
VDFFLLNDLVDARGDVKFYLPFDGFASRPQFRHVADYLAYKEGVERFVLARSERMQRYAAGL